MKPFQEVFTTGQPTEGLRSWSPRSGKINEIGELILYTASVGVGYSGGPLVDGDGSLIGMNTQIEKAAGVCMPSPSMSIHFVNDKVWSWVKN